MSAATTHPWPIGALLRLALASSVALAAAACAYDVGDGDPENVGQASHELVAPGDPTGARGPSSDLTGTTADPGGSGGPTPDPWTALDLDPGGPTPDPWLQSGTKQASGTGNPQDPGADPDPSGTGSSGVTGQRH